MRLGVRLTRAGKKVRGELKLIEAAGEGDTRRVEGESCDAVVEVLSLTAALALTAQPPRVLPPPPPPPPPRRVPPPRAHPRHRRRRPNPTRPKPPEPHTAASPAATSPRAAPTPARPRKPARSSSRRCRRSTRAARTSSSGCTRSPPTSSPLRSVWAARSPPPRAARGRRRRRIVRAGVSLRARTIPCRPPTICRGALDCDRRHRLPAVGPRSDRDRCSRARRRSADGLPPRSRPHQPAQRRANLVERGRIAAAGAHSAAASPSSSRPARTVPLVGRRSSRPHRSGRWAKPLLSRRSSHSDSRAPFDNVEGYRRPLR